ncbi:hypothetical protein CCR94_16525 [Rhodoblastus sphagnicola]|uniref:Uncharacterized protein n=1 Tax=Rhodoblastus sphagnicola TaxID=333368 RepID=A0A2S6N2Z2_9HYPH|nr:hypothetical protein [Rhodoblastus sphagnicola]MBB4199104.1 hypothetical protein [Rhodoblastus sphagnicola]PPQ28995.1 hypothetical protein CCR94_16525 [Rhodoblastus sphagnicola]
MKHALFAFVMLLSSSCFAAPTFKADEFATAFNEAARKLKIDTRFALQQCAKDDRDTCTYQASEHVAALIVKRASGLTGVVIWDGDSKSMADWLLSISVAMEIFSPSVDKDQRGVALRTIMSGFKGKDKKGEAMLDGEKYALQVVQGMGLWFSIDPAE